jgi:hypothetical protein
MLRLFASGLPMSHSGWSWTDYLPPSLQLWEVWLAVAVSFAVVAWGSTLPKNWNAPYLVHLYAFLGSLLVIAPTLGMSVWQYSVGTALIASAIANQLYALVLPMITQWLMARIRAIFGISPPVAEPVTPDPQNQPPKNNS